jgi:hypothetical protein
LNSRRVTALAALYVGVRPTRLLGVGLEALELYTIAYQGAPLEDRLRATMVVSPNARLMTPWVQPAISFFTNVGPPLDGHADRIWGLRLAVTLVYDSTTRTLEPGTPGHAQ